MIHPAWDDLSLEVSRDLPWQAQYRRLQSWYREKVLDVPPGIDRYGIARGNVLPEDEVDRNPGLNFLDDDIAAYAYERMARPGTIDSDRLKRNMLSSMPLCFNLFGALRRHPVAAARGLTATLNLDIDDILEIKVEWAPDPYLHLRDRTAFDTFIRYRNAEGRHAFLGVETKYTENPFDEERIYTSPRYTAVTRDSASGFRYGAESRLAEAPTNQLWRNALLVCSLRSTHEFDDGHLVVLSSAENESVAAAVNGLERELHSPKSLVRFATYDDLVARLCAQEELSSWAAKFRQRYLDLSTVRRGVHRAWRR